MKKQYIVHLHLNDKPKVIDDCDPDVAFECDDMFPDDYFNSDSNSYACDAMICVCSAIGRLSYLILPQNIELIEFIRSRLERMRSIAETNMADTADTIFKQGPDWIYENNYIMREAIRNNLEEKTIKALSDRMSGDIGMIAITIARHAQSETIVSLMSSMIAILDDLKNKIERCIANSLDFPEQDFLAIKCELNDLAGELDARMSHTTDLEADFRKEYDKSRRAGKIIDFDPIIKNLSDDILKYLPSNCKKG